MNDGERLRDARIAGLSDRALLDALAGHGSELSATESAAFLDMASYLWGGRRLYPKQRAWAEEVARRVFPISAADVPAGRPVETPAVLRELPKRPPGRRQT